MILHFVATPQFTHLLMDFRYVSTFWLLCIVLPLSAQVDNISVQVFVGVPVFGSFGYLPRSGIAG